MDRDKYPNYFLVIIILYAIVVLGGLAYFIFPSLSFGLGYADFYIILALMFAPLVLFGVYEKKNIGWLRLVITALTIIDLLIVLYMMFLLM